MDYEKIYEDFIADRLKNEPDVYSGLNYTQRWRKGSWASGSYFEHHHILPTSLGGEDTPENVVSLSGGDHYFAHLCLWKIHRTSQTRSAVLFMAHATNLKGRAVEVFSRRRIVQLLKEQHSKEQTIWTEEAVLEDSQKYDSISDWVSANGSAYNAAIRHGIFDQCTAHMSRKRFPNGYWSEERLLRLAEDCETIRDLKRKSLSAYKAAHRTGLLKTKLAHLERAHVWDGRSDAWTRERTLESALPYETISDWKRALPGAYRRACESGWLEEATAHMVDGRVRHGLRHRKPVKCVETGKVYDSCTLAGEAMGVSRFAITQAVKKGGRSGGYHWVTA